MSALCLKKDLTRTGKGLLLRAREHHKTSILDNTN